MLLNPASVWAVIVLPDFGDRVPGELLASAAVGIMRALNVERVFDPSRKKHHWGRRKLARDR